VWLLFTDLTQQILAQNPCLQQILQSFSEKNRVSFQLGNPRSSALYPTAAQSVHLVLL
jgi:hypothetical protein